MVENVAKKLEFRGIKYDFQHAKHNVLVYSIQPEHHYSDWEEDGGILVVEYRPDAPENGRYYVLHAVRVYYQGGFEHVNLTTCDKNERCATPVEN